MKGSTGTRAGLSQFLISETFKQASLSIRDQYPIIKAGGIRLLWKFQLIDVRGLMYAEVIS